MKLIILAILFGLFAVQTHGLKGRLLQQLTPEQKQHQMMAMMMHVKCAGLLAKVKGDCSKLEGKNVMMCKATCDKIADSNTGGWSDENIAKFSAKVLKREGDQFTAEELDLDTPFNLGGVYTSGKRDVKKCFEKLVPMGVTSPNACVLNFNNVNLHECHKITITNGAPLFNVGSNIIHHLLASGAGYKSDYIMSDVSQTGKPLETVAKFLKVEGKPVLVIHEPFKSETDYFTGALRFFNDDNTFMLVFFYCEEETGNCEFMHIEMQRNFEASKHPVFEDCHAFDSQCEKKFTEDGEPWMYTDTMCSWTAGCGAEFPTRASSNPKCEPICEDKLNEFTPYTCDGLIAMFGCDNSIPSMEGTVRDAVCCASCRDQ